MPLLMAVPEGFDERLFVPPVVVEPGRAAPAASFAFGCIEHGINWERGCSGCIEYLACDAHRERVGRGYALQVEAGIRGLEEHCPDCQWRAYSLGYRDFQSCPDHRGYFEISCRVCLVILACQWHKTTDRLLDVQASITGGGTCLACFDNATAQGYHYRPSMRVAGAAPAAATKSVGRFDVF
jgi:hypothetical protein